MKLVADNLHIINPVIRNALDTLDPKPIREIVARCERAGADAIDINAGPLSRAPAEKMTFLVETVQSISTLPILIDTTNPEALEAGLQASKNTIIINGFSLEPPKLKNILPLAKKYKSDIIGYLLYPDSSVPKDASERFDLAIQIHKAIHDNGIEDHQLIIDPIIVPLSWQDGIRQAPDPPRCVFMGGIVIHTKNGSMQRKKFSDISILQERLTCFNLFDMFLPNSASIFLM